MTIINSTEVKSDVPEWYKKPCMMGIDEAGRGPVLGPMVYGCAYCPLEHAEDLKKKQFSDSKVLTPEKRDTLYDSLDKDEYIDCIVDEISSADISGAMLQARQQTNLNQLAIESTFKIITKALQMGADLQEIYVDTLGDPGKHKERLSHKFPGIQFTVCSKADSIYPIVSAASIAAKVWRDRALENLLESVEGGKMTNDTCSGYPGDEATKEWLAAHKTPVFGFPSLVRFSWATAKTLIDKDCTKVDWECEEENPEQQSLESMMNGGANSKAAAAKNRHSYFRARKLQRVHTGF